MKKIIKKSIAVFMCFIFIISAVSISSAFDVDNSVQSLEEESESSFKEITFYRYGPDNSITPITVTVEIKNNQEIEEAIENKCLELFENDKEMKNLVTSNDNTSNNTSKNSTSKVLLRIRSRGRGLHFKSTFRMQLLKRLKLFPFLPPYFRTAIFMPNNYCKYSNDPKAKTVIRPIATPSVNKTYEGPHSVLNIGFIGYTGWIGHISYLGFILRRGYVGLTAFSIVREL